MTGLGLARRLGFGLSRELWLVQIGIFLNMLGYGAVTTAAPVMVPTTRPATARLNPRPLCR